MVTRYPIENDPGLDHIPEGERLLAQGSVVQARMEDGRLVWLALGYRAVRQVLTDQRFSREAASRPGGPVTTPSAATDAVLSSMDPPRHTRVRRLMANAFSPRTVEALEPRIRELVGGLLDEFTNPCDLVERLAEPLPFLVICELLGVPTEDRTRIRDWAGRLMSLTAYTLEEITEAGDQVRDYLGDLVERRRAEPDGGLISELVRVNDEEGHLTALELAYNLQMLLMAGHETTINQIANSAVTLFGHPGQIALLRKEPGRWPQAVEELFRHAMLMQSTLARVTTEDLELDGTPVPAGEAVIPMIGVANRDPAAWPDPHRFDITRENPAPHVGLGHGTHFCLGAQLARLEIRTAFELLFDRFPAITPVDDLAKLRWKEGQSVRTLEELPVAW
jgi:cytochrome P450